MNPPRLPLARLRFLVGGSVTVASILMAFGIDAWWDSRQDRASEREAPGGMYGIPAHRETRPLVGHRHLAQQWMIRASRERLVYAERMPELVDRNPGRQVVRVDPIDGPGGPVGSATGMLVVMLVFCADRPYAARF